MQAFNRSSMWLGIRIGLTLAGLAFGQKAYAKEFPRIEERKGNQEIIRSYQPYLQLVTRVGQRVDSQKAQFLSTRYAALQKRSPELAARFLKGLRFEIEHKRDLWLGSRNQLSPDSAATQQWVKRFIGNWGREADELLLRSVVASN